MEGDFTHLTHGFSHTPSVYSASNLDDDTTSIASSRLTRDRDNQTINDDDAFSEVNGDDTASVVGLAARRQGGGAGDGDVEEDIETLTEQDAKLPDWACAYVFPPLKISSERSALSPLFKGTNFADIAVFTPPVVL